MFHFTNGDEYFYDESVVDGDHESVIDCATANSTDEHTAVFSEELVEELLTGVTPSHVCGKCGQPHTRTFEKVPRPFVDTERPQAQRSAEIFAESQLTEEHVEAIQAVGISDVGKAKVTEDGAGRNDDRVQQLAAEAKGVLGGYYREFTMVERQANGWEQQCNCDATSVAPIVCDPFAGTGTTLKVAKDMGHSWFGIDLYPKYVEMCHESLVDENRRVV